jgi:dCTP diphosphatase
MKVLNVEKIQNELKTFAEQRDWDQFHSVKNLTMALSVETSELVEIFQWMKEEDSNSAHTDPKIKQRAAEEIADVFVYLLRIAKKLNIDLEEATWDKMRKNEEKYPIDKARGQSKKYDEL